MKPVRVALLAASLAAILASPLTFAQDEPTPPVPVPVPEEKAPAETGEEPAAAEKPDGPQMDDLAKATYEAFEKKVYNLADAGVKTASFNLSFSMKGGMMPIDVSAKYTWDGKQGSLEWSDPMLGQALAQQGVSSAQFNAMFKKSAALKELGNAKLTSKKNEDGSVHITVSDHQQVKSITFNPEGLISSMVRSMPSQMGPQDITIKDMQWKKIGDRYHQTGYSVELEVPGMGKYEETTEITLTEVNGFQVQQKSVSKGKLGEMMNIEKVTEFTDWKLNGVGAAATETPPTEDK